MRGLLDANALIALLDPQHVGHTVANEWLVANTDVGWASCPLTENAYLRLLMNPRYPRPLSAEVALSRLATTKSESNHAFWADDLSITDAGKFHPKLLRGHQQITDTYLLALAIAHGGSLVTFDQRIPRAAVVGCRDEQLIVLSSPPR